MPNSGLAALLAKKAQADGQATDAQVPASGESESVTPTPQGEGAKAQRPANPFAKGQGGGSADTGGQPESGPATSSGDDSGSEQPRPGLAAATIKSQSQHSGSDTGSVVAPVIDSLDALDQSEDTGIVPRGSGLSRYEDETPATKPTRELPEGITKDQLGFIDMIDGVYDVLGEHELLGGVIRNIIIELKEHPEYMKLIVPDDVRQWVKGMRDSMGLKKIQKTEAKAKRSGGAGRKSKLIDDQMMDDLESLGIDIPS